MKSIRTVKGVQGFTLIELMVCVGILGIVAVPLLRAYFDSKKFSEDHIRFTRAASALSMQMEILKRGAFSSLNNGKDQPLDPNVKAMIAELEGGDGSISISNDPGASQIKRIGVEVRWTNPWGRKKSLNSVLLRAGP